MVDERSAGSARRAFAFVDGSEKPVWRQVKALALACKRNSETGAKVTGHVFRCPSKPGLWVPVPAWPVHGSGAIMSR